VELFYIVNLLENPSLLDNEYEEKSLIEEENFRAGRVVYGMYSYYIKEFGIIIFASFFVSLFVLFTAARVVSSLYMANWTTNSPNMTRSESLHNLILYGSFGLTGGNRVFNYINL
jgi:hypothetical protein